MHSETAAPTTLALDQPQTSLRRAFIVARREVRDSLRDWRIIGPIIILTLFFPWLMDWTASLAVGYIERQGADPILGERLVPFLLMIVGFFPISFSLVIALETFVGEKERHSLEPLLSTPMSDGELYLGKMIAATAVPLLASYLGIAIYLLGLRWTLHWTPSGILLVQILLLTTLEAMVMVAGAVVVSSHTTSVRAANLLASFIIVPMALLVQAESIIMFWGRYAALWLVAAALAIVLVIIIRTGIRIFNREEMLGREMDELNLRRAWQIWRYYFLHSPYPRDAEPAGGLGRWVLRVYRRDLPALLRQNWRPMLTVGVALVAALFMGWVLADQYPLPEGMLNLEDLPADAFRAVPDISFLPGFSVSGILLNNVRSLAVGSVLGLVSLGTLAVMLLMAPLAIVGFLGGQVLLMGYNPLLFLLAFIVPHGLVEIPAAVIATGLALRLGASLTTSPPNRTVGDNFLQALADLVKTFVFLVVPLLLVAAVIEVTITPRIVLWVYGG
jgi:uncharacterized membrane protein SpoIIM required for sporulation